MRLDELREAQKHPERYGDLVVRVGGYSDLFVRLSKDLQDNIIARTALKDMEYDTANLYFCGGHYIRGDGYPSGYMTGHMAAEAVIEALKEGK